MKTPVVPDKYAVSHAVIAVCGTVRQQAPDINKLACEVGQGIKLIILGWLVCAKCYPSCAGPGISAFSMLFDLAATTIHEHSYDLLLLS